MSSAAAIRLTSHAFLLAKPARRQGWLAFIASSIVGGMRMLIVVDVSGCIGLCYHGDAGLATQKAGGEAPRPVPLPISRRGLV